MKTTTKEENLTAGLSCEKISDLAFEAIAKNKLVFMEDVCAYVPCSRTHFYSHGLDKLETINEALQKQKVNIKISIRAKLYKDNSATGLIALYKLLGTQEEIDRLNGRSISANIDMGEKGEITLVVHGSRSNLLDPETI